MSEGAHEPRYWHVITDAFVELIKIKKSDLSTKSSFVLIYNTFQYWSIFVPIHLNYINCINGQSYSRYLGVAGDISCVKGWRLSFEGVGQLYWACSNNWQMSVPAQSPTNGTFKIQPIILDNNGDSEDLETWLLSAQQKPKWDSSFFCLWCERL